LPFFARSDIEVLRVRRGTGARAVRALPRVAAPDVARDRYASVPAGSLERGALICPAFKPSAAARRALAG
jgi:hypothetical protein